MPLHLDLNRFGFARAFITLCALLALSAPADAQSPSTTSAVTRTVLAQTKLHVHGKVSLFMGAVGVVVPTGQTSNLSSLADGILYQMSGSTEIAVDGAIKNLAAREALFVPAGKRVALKAGNDIPSTLMHFLLGRAADLDRSGATAPATVIKIYRSPGAIPNIKAGVYDLNLTTATFSPHTPLNPPHHRSGAALYYVLFGTGAYAVGGETARKGVGSVVYETYGLVHQWGNPGDEPLRFVVFNINLEGVPAVVGGAAAKAR
jgi:quercetin dioxygenase-like cupin family protein